jgi:hypothetical protein
MDSLVRCRELWEKVKDLRIPDAMEMVINDVEGHNGTAEKVELLNKNNNGINELASAIPVKKTKRSKGQRVAEAARPTLKLAVQSACVRLRQSLQYCPVLLPQANEDPNLNFLIKLRSRTKKTPTLARRQL